MTIGKGLAPDSTVRLIKFSREDFLSIDSAPLIELLTTVINTGYEYNKRYRVIETTRIKDPGCFINDLGLYKPESFMLALIKTGGDVDPATWNHDLKIEDSKGFDTSTVKPLDILGTIGGKRHQEAGDIGWELTGVVSFVKGVGSLLINTIGKLAIEQDVKHLFCTIIYEHGLVDYYAKFGFFEYKQKMLQRIDENGLVIGGELEDGVFALRDFHIAFLRKQLG